MKRLFLLLIAVLITLSLAACGSGTSTVFANSPKNAVAAVIAEFPEYGDLTFNYPEDEYSEDVLSFMYGIIDDSCVSAVEDFALSERLGMTALTLAVITFKDGTTDEIIKTTSELIKTEYVDALASALAVYDPDQASLAKQYTMKIYDNAIVLVIYGEDNDGVIAAAEK